MVCRLFLLLACLLPVGAAAGAEQALRVLVLDDAPPLSYRDQSGQLTGFNVEIVRAVCREIQVRCQFEVTTQGAVVDAVAQGKADIAGVGLQQTPERQGKLIFAKAPELKEEIDAALDRIKRNGTYDRINSRFLPFRVS